MWPETLDEKCYKNIHNIPREHVLVLYRNDKNPTYRIMIITLYILLTTRNNLKQSLDTFWVSVRAQYAVLYRPAQVVRVIVNLSYILGFT